MQPQGYRLLSRIPRLPESVIDHIVEHFGNLAKIMRATIDDLDDVEGVGEHPGQGHQGRPVAAWPSRASSTATPDRRRARPLAIAPVPASAVSRSGRAERVG